MRVAILSAAPAVSRTLEAILRAAGHSPVTTDEAEYYLIDARHPVPVPETHLPCLTLVPGPTQQEGKIATPLRPAQLLRLLAQASATQPIPLGQGWMVDGLARTLSHPEAAPVPLTEKECQLLQALLTGTPMRREALLAQLWGITQEIETHTLETHMYRLRHKLGELHPPAADIITEGGTYRLVPLA